MARPQKDIDPKLVHRLAAELTSWPDLARILGVSERTLHRRFARVIEQGRTEWRCTLRKLMVKQAKRGSFLAQKFLACQPEWRGGLGWTEEVTHEHRGTVVVAVSELQAAITAAQSTPALARANGHANGNGHAPADGLL